MSCRLLQDVLVTEHLPESLASTLNAAVASGDRQRWIRLVTSCLAAFEQLAATEVINADIKPGHFRLARDDR